MFETIRSRCRRTPRRFTLVVLTAFVAVAAGASGSLAESEGFAALVAKKRIGVSQCVTHPILDQVRAGIVKGLEKNRVDASLDVQISEFDQSLAVTIAQKFVSQSVDLIISICTPNTLAAISATKTIPIVFSYVTDPVAAGIVKNPKRPGGNVTGTQSRQPSEQWAELTKQLVPRARTIGVVLNPADEGSKASFPPFEKRAKRLGMRIRVAAANSSGEVKAAAESLVGKVGAIFQAGDGTAESAIAAIVKVANDNKIPLLGSELGDAKAGATLAIGENAFAHGVGTAGIVTRILRDGRDPGSIPVWSRNRYYVHINLVAAKRQGVTVPKALLKRAKVIYRK